MSSVEEGMEAAEEMKLAIVLQGLVMHRINVFKVKANAVAGALASAALALTAFTKYPLEAVGDDLGSPSEEAEGVNWKWPALLSAVCAIVSFCEYAVIVKGGEPDSKYKDRSTAEIKSEIGRIREEYQERIVEGKLILPWNSTADSDPEMTLCLAGKVFDCEVEFSNLG